MGRSFRARFRAPRVRAPLVFTGCWSREGVPDAGRIGSMRSRRSMTGADVDACVFFEDAAPPDRNVLRRVQMLGRRGREA